jgi:small subunit ribosomal protein S11
MSMENSENRNSPKEKEAVTDGNGGAGKNSSEAPEQELARPTQLTAAELLQGDLNGEIKIRRAKKSKNLAVGICHVLATFNNTKVSFSDCNGAVISWSSAGKNNFRGSRKSTAYAAQVVVQDAARAAMAHGLKEVDVWLKGPGMGRDAAVRALQTVGLQINGIMDVTPIPHNGCRPKKPRRA